MPGVLDLLSSHQGVPDSNTELFFRALPLLSEDTRLHTCVYASTVLGQSPGTHKLSKHSTRAAALTLWKPAHDVPSLVFTDYATMYCEQMYKWVPWQQLSKEPPC